MSTKQDYTSFARKFTYRFPQFTYVSIQINFWVVASLLYSLIIFLNTKNFFQLRNIDFPLSISSLILVSVTIGVLLGVFLFVIDFLFTKLKFNKLPSALVIILKILTYIIGVFLIVYAMKFFLTERAHYLVRENEIFDINSNFIWRSIFWSFLIYVGFMAGVISFINQMNSMFGPGILIPLMMGKYRTPKEQDRLFMFLDLKSSTTHAEELGHIVYSSFIRDCFIDLNKVAVRNNAEIYQYVGDEAVITWQANDGLSIKSSFSLFYQFQEIIEKRQSYYLKRYNRKPVFKAGLHQGIVTAVEVGEIKKEIAYHGDTINTAARIQAKCNEFGELLLISEKIKESIEKENYTFNLMGDICLKGKSELVKIYNVRELKA